MGAGDGDPTWFSESWPLPQTAQKPPSRGWPRVIRHPTRDTHGLLRSHHACTEPAPCKQLCEKSALRKLNLLQRDACPVTHPTATWTWQHAAWQILVAREQAGNTLGGSLPAPASCSPARTVSCAGPVSAPPERPRPHYCYFFRLCEQPSPPLGDLVFQSRGGARRSPGTLNAPAWWLLSHSLVTGVPRLCGADSPGRNRWCP